MRRRFTVATGAMAFAMIGLSLRLALLHLHSHENAISRAKRNRQVERRLVAPRGNVCDANGEENILALNLPVKDVCADPQTVVKHNGVADVAGRLAKTLELPADEIAVRLNRADRRFAYVKRYVPEEDAEAIEKHRLAGVFFCDNTTRYYPLKTFMCHVLGFVNYEGVGSAGVEQSMDKYLRGSVGLLESRVNALQQELNWRYGHLIPALQGSDVRITLDQNIQYITEKALDEVMEEHRAKGAWAIVERVRTGEILAMASRPCFDPNDFRTADAAAVRNNAIAAVYEPGSTFKPLVIGAALNEKTVTSETIFDCENGAWQYAGRALHDYRPHGKLTVADGLKKSSNILTAKVALMLGEKRMYEYLRRFNMGTKMGIDLPGEENGILHPTAQWSAISPTRIAIGQGIAVTALQMLGMFCAIANEGFLMKPYVTKHVEGDNDGIIFQGRPEVLSRPISPETAALLCRLLNRVTEEGGTGVRARVEGYEVAGKTGTAQKPEKGGYSDTRYVASFVGFLPAAAPEIGAIVVVDEPANIRVGGVVAAPAFGKIAGQTARYLGIPPTRQMVAKDAIGSNNQGNSTRGDNG